jgi:NAD(P)-dependent dehydrogenase (short-subunit alcohol dehydrogenase family)
VSSTASTVDLAGRVAVVTGGGRGIGAAIARELAGAGARVVVAGRNHELLRGIAAELGEGALALRCDLSVPAEVGALVETVRRDAGPPAIVVNNAGIAHSAKLAETDEETWNRIVDVNLNGSYRVARAFWPDLLQAGASGRLIFIASVAAKIGFTYTSAYCAAKHGVLGLCRALALEAGARGPTVNCVCPGWVDTDMAADAIDNIARKTGRSREEARKELERMSPQRRLITAGEIAAATRFLCSDGARGVNGQGFNVDGGQVMS